MGGWAVAQSPIMITTVTLERLRKRGYEAMLNYYSKVSPALNEPLYLPAGRQVCDPGVYPDEGRVQWCERRTSSPTSGEARLLD